MLLLALLATASARHFVPAAPAAPGRGANAVRAISPIRSCPPSFCKFFFTKAERTRASALETQVAPAGSTWALSKSNCVQMC